MSRTQSLGQVFRAPAESRQTLESAALIVGAAVFVIAAVIAAITFGGKDLPISGPGSLGQFVAIVGGITGFVVFIFGRLVMRTRKSRLGALENAEYDAAGVRLRWYDVAALALAHGVIAILAWTGLAALLGISFKGALVFTFSAIVLAGVATALTSYVVFLSSVHLSAMLLSLVLAAFIVSGAITSMMSATDPLWWQKNLSTLGIGNDISSLAFNVTLIIAGIMVTTIAHYATAPLPASTRAEARGRTLVRVGLMVIGILLALVGAFPLDRSETIHNYSASGMAVVYVALVIAFPWLVPSIPRVFVVLGYVYVGVIVVLAVFFISGYYNLTAVELVAFTLIFSWLIVLLRNTGEPTDAPQRV
ncbi:hypothetical protein G3T36_00215 [Diaminobutyricibacter tongyongensis]|uniref:DUF998 domain-containing protein n=1 Tax=Leifsonia tongyongensis TaxID=1268043 RepID=A0A6L9XSJ5_9MICO|nr:DUF998 domain-containing protein [Diaminobutyricibacter tongyongensis]NEN04286.1 hypothetical protein [Diaminobutyricibacter tongyongensis]